MAVNKDAENREVQLPDLNRPEVGHEEKDVNAWAVGKFASALVLVCIAALFLLAGLFRIFEARDSAGQPVPARGLNRDATALPPEPRLQAAPILDLQQMRAAENQILNSYGWVDRQSGIVRLPINRAMDLLVQGGLPSRPAEQRPPGSAASTPTESGLGEEMILPGGPLAESK